MGVVCNYLLSRMRGTSEYRAWDSQEALPLASRSIWLCVRNHVHTCHAWVSSNNYCWVGPLDAMENEPRRDSSASFAPVCISTPGSYSFFAFGYTIGEVAKAHTVLLAC